MTKYKKPAIVTCYNQYVEEKLFYYHKMVVDKFRGNIPYLSFKYPYHETEMLHGDMLNKYLHHVFYELGGDCILFIDIDCIPLNKECLEFTLDLAYQGYLVGNVQRANHIENNQHVYAGSSYICFSEKTFEVVGRPTMSYSHVGDTCEQMTYNCEKAGVPIKLFTPGTVDSPYNEQGDYWDLNEDLPKYGIGTTFMCDGVEMNYHLFCARQHKFNKLFYDKCHNILMN